MKREVITIENGIVHIPQSIDVWMSQHENDYRPFVSHTIKKCRSISRLADKTAYQSGNT